MDAKGGQVGSNEGLRKGKGDPKAMKEDMLVVQRRPKWDPRVFGGLMGTKWGQNGKPIWGSWEVNGRPREAEGGVFLLKPFVLLYGSENAFFDISHVL